MDRHSGGGPPPHLRGRPVSGLEAAHASEYFEPFLNATTLKNILGYHRSMCELLHLKPNVFTHFYPKLRANLTSWRAKALWKKFDARASHKCYGKGKACSGIRVLIIGAGPCGLRTAIEAQLLGAKVVVIEKRDRLSRNNVLHLWPFVIEDLRMLGAKKFFGKFCAGAIDHISIRQLQCILLKVALLLGVEVHTEVSFEKLLEPSATEKTGWRAEFKPENHPVSQYEFDVIIGADGKRNTLQGFNRKEFRGKLAIAITANFINKKTEAEARVEEISGVAFIFNQKFFKDLQEETRIDLENIVYYKDDTHYFVMTAKKASLLEKGVIKQDLADTEKLLAPDNVDREALQNYARQAADFSTNYQLPELEFAVNHYGLPDVAMFDFTSMYAAEYASKVVERHGSRLLMILVGDSLLEPFWPTGSGCARGFLSSLDAAWAIRSYCSGQMTPLDVLAERESIYRLLAQTTPDNLNKDWKAYTLDPVTRYPNLNKSVVTPHQTVCLYDTDNPDSIDKMKRTSLEAASRQEHVSKKRRRGNVDNEVLINWLSEQLREHEDITVTDLSSVFRDGKTLCAIIHHYRPDLLDYNSAIRDNEPAKCNQLAMDILEKDLGLPPFMTGEEITNTDDFLAMATYLTQVYDTFRGEIPHIKHPKLNTTKTATKISKNISKLPKSRKIPFPPAVLAKPNTVEKKYSRTTVINERVPTSKHKHGKASGDETPDNTDNNAEKLKLMLKHYNMRTRTEESIAAEKERKKISSDDLIVRNEQKSKIPKKKAPNRHTCNETRPLKTLSEQTFLNASIKSLKTLEKEKNKGRCLKSDFFDLTYSNEGLLKNPKKTKNEVLSPELMNAKKTKKSNKTSNVSSGEDHKVKKVKSRNVSVLVKLSDSNTPPKKKIKTKKSKLSVIPENIEEKLSKTTKCPENMSKYLEQNNKVELAEIKTSCESSESQVTNVTSNNSYKQRRTDPVFRCETFVQDSFDSLVFPCGSFSNTPPEKKHFINTRHNETTSSILNKQILSPHRRMITSSNASLGKLKQAERSSCNLFGLRKLSPLQIIRKHLQMKKQQLSLIFSKLRLPSYSNNADILSKTRVKLPMLTSANTSPNVSYDSNSQKPLSPTINTYSKDSLAKSTQSINIEVIHKSSSDVITCQNVEYKSSLNVVEITSKNFKSDQKLPTNAVIRKSVEKLVVLSSTDESLGAKKAVRTRIQKRTYCDNTSVRTKTVEQIFDNKEKFVKDNVSSYLGSTRCPCTPRLDKRRFPDFNRPRRTRIRKSKTHLPIKEKPFLTPADAQIINSLGTSVIQTSNVTCSKTSKSYKDYCLKSKKFSLQNNLRNLIVKKQHLHGDLRAGVRRREEFCKGISKLGTNLEGNAGEMHNMEFYDDDDSISPQLYTRVQRWISQHDFKSDELKKDPEGETLITCDIPSDITSVTRTHARKKGEYDDIKVEERTDVVRCESPITSSQEDFVELVRSLKDGKSLNVKDNKSVIKPVSKYSQYNMKSVSAPPANFSIIVEGEESELPESNKRSEFSFKSIKTTNQQPPPVPNNQPSRPSSRHKRHAEAIAPKPCSIDKKQRKRRTLERIGPSVIYSRWFLPLLETVVVGLMLLMFDMYVNPEEYIEAPTSFLDYIWM